MQIWPREFWRNPHLFCTTSTSTFGRVWRDPARAALKPKAATSCFQRSAPPSWISNAWHWIHMSNSGRNAKEKSWPGIASPQISFLNLGSFTNKTSLEAKMNTKWLFFPFPASCWDILQVCRFHESDTLTSESFWNSVFWRFRGLKHLCADVFSLCLAQTLPSASSSSLLRILNSHLLNTVRSSNIEWICD